MVTGSAAATPALRPSAAQSLRIGRAAPYARLPKAESPSTMTNTVLSLKNAALALDGNAGRVDILKGITLDVVRGETLGSWDLRVLASRRSSCSWAGSNAQLAG